MALLIEKLFILISPIRKLKYLWFFFCLGILFVPYSSHAQKKMDFTEYEIKAALIYKFILFVEWPENAFIANSNEINLTILGRDPFGSILDQFEGKEIKGKILRIKRAQDVSEIDNCQVLFISASEKNRLKEIFNHLKNSPILLIGDSTGFAKSGGIINFYFNQKGMVRFEINVDAKNRSKVKISSKLLRLARIVQEDS